MAQSKYIQSVKRAAAGRNLSIEWYRKKMQEFGKPNGNQLIQDGKRGSSPFYGLLNMFFYDPKLKEKLHSLCKVQVTQVKIRAELHWINMNTT